MKLQTDIRVRATIEVDDREAEMIEHLCGYGIAKEFASKFSHRYSEEQITATLAAIRQQAEKICKAKRAAEEAAFNAMR